MENKKEYLEDLAFGAYDSEMQGWSYTIPEGFTAEIKDGQVIVKRAESEDERIRKGLIDYLKADMEHNPSQYPQFYDRAIAYLERQKEQKPAEWSEEDDKRVKQLIYDTEAIRAGYEKRKEQLGERFNNELIKDCDKQIAWLKSLRPQPHWKPSEEQMAVLSNAERLVRANNYTENAKILAGLYEQLKKL